jgi:hypothetical protein
LSIDEIKFGEIATKVDIKLKMPMHFFKYKTKNKRKLKVCFFIFGFFVAESALLLSSKDALIEAFYTLSKRKTRNQQQSQQKTINFPI